MNYKAPDNSVHFLDDDSFVHLLPAGSIAITPEEAEALKPVPPPEPIPAISPRQIRQALTRAALRASVEAAVAAGDQDLKDWYEFSTAFERLNPQVTAMGVALNVSEQQLDDLWALGASL
jgi:hypothetical protein